MKIAIIGTGAVGGYFGAKLAHAGYDVSFLARGTHLEAIQKRGIQVKSTFGDFHVNTGKVTDRIQSLGEPDLIILAVKAWQVKEVREDLKKITGKYASILPLQNGILAADELEEQIDSSRIIGGLCRIISKIETPGVINHLGVTPTIVFGELNKTSTERSLRIKELFDQAGIKAEISKDIEADLWKKLIAICVSGLLAVSRTTYGELRELKETRILMIQLLTEIYDLSQAKGINIEADFVEKSVSFIDSFPFDSTSSLTRDVWEGNPSEIEYQNGTVVRLGEKLGVNTPINKFVYECILPMEKKARRQ